MQLLMGELHTPNNQFLIIMVVQCQSKIPSVGITVWHHCKPRYDKQLPLDEGIFHPHLTNHDRFLLSSVANGVTEHSVSGCA